jgi:hypothetical protein
MKLRAPEAIDAEIAKLTRRINMALSKEEKKQFIQEFIGRVQESLLSKLDRVPEEWDGYELREWIADTFDFERQGMMSAKRRKDYKNEVIVRNL